MSIFKSKKHSKDSKTSCASYDPSSVLATIDEIYVAKVTFISNHDDGSGLGPRCIDFYLLTKLENDEYHEFFSGKKLEQEKDCHEDDSVIFKKFNTIYIEEIKPLNEYLLDKSLKTVDFQSLFDFLVDINVSNALGEFDDEDEDEDEDEYER